MVLWTGRMRLYLSSFRLGNATGELLSMLRGGSRCAVIANADDFKDPDDRRASSEREVGDLRSLGLDPVEVDLRRFFGHPTALGRHLESFDLVWVRGGNAFLLRRALAYSGADLVLPDLLRRDVVVFGGYSAGVVVLTPSLLGINLIDDPSLVADGYDPAILWDGLGLLPYHVMPHYRSDHPESPDVERAVRFLIDSHVLFLALRDGEVIVRDGSREEVVG